MYVLGWENKIFGVELPHFMIPDFQPYNLYYMNVTILNIQPFNPQTELLSSVILSYNYFQYEKYIYTYIYILCKI